MMLPRHHVVACTTVDYAATMILMPLIFMFRFFRAFF